MKKISDTIKKLLLEIEKRGFEGEIYFSEDESLTISYKKGEIDSIRKSLDRGIGVRIFKDKKMVFFNTVFKDNLNFKKLLDSAEILLKNSKPDDANLIPEPEEKYRGVEKFDEKILRIDVDRLKKIVFKYDKLIKEQKPFLWFSSCNKGVARRAIVSSKGINLYDEQTSLNFGFSLYFEKEGEKWESGDYVAVRRFSDIEKMEIEKRIKKEADRARKLVGAKPIKTQSLPVLYDLQTSSFFLWIISSLLNGNNLYHRESFISKDDIGKKIFSEKINIYEDPFIPYGLRSRGFDDEGIPCRKRKIVERGVIKGTFENYRSAFLNKRKPTGNASRGGYDSIPGISPSNLILENGDKDIQEIISKIDRGFYCLGTIGFGVDRITGNYSRGAYGFLIERGEIKKPVARVTLASNLKNMLNNIQALSKEYDISRGFRSPAILISEMKVGGI